MCFCFTLYASTLKSLSLSKDLEWDGESKRIIAVGEGREK